MANFLDNLSSYNAKAALAISNAVAAGDTQKANMMSSLKSTANDETLSEAVRLNALTALVNLGSLLEIPLPPYFPMSVQYADIQTYEGVHNDLLGIQGGAPNEYYHLTFAERAAIASAASLSDITFANLIGVYSDNAGLAGVINAKQAALSAPVGDHFVKINGTTISYDNSVYLTSSTGLASGSAAGGDLGGTYPNPTVLNSAVISKLLVGWNGSASNVPVTSSDSILTGMQKLNARINDIVANPGGVSSVALSTNAPAIFDGTAAQTGAATVTLGLRNQNANLFLASSSTLPNTQPTFRAIAVDDLPTASGVTPTQYGSTSLIPQITVDSKGRITAIANVTAAAGGQVNSVTLSVPSGSIYSSSATGTATDPVLNFSVQSQAPNTVYAGPASGSSNVVPSFRALVAADIASIPIPQSQVTGLGDTLATFMTNSLANSTMYVGNASNAAVNAAVAGDLTMAYVDNNGTNEANFTIANSAVTYAKIQNVTAETILGRYSATNGTVQQLTLDPSDFTINNSTGVIGLVTPNPPTLTTKGDLLTSNGTAQVRLGIGADATLFMADSAAATGNKWVAMSGDATIAVSGALTIANSAVTLGKMANLAANSIIGNNTGSSATPIALTATQATAMLNLFDTATTTKGLVQGSNGADNTHFLRADNTWQPITGTGTVTSVSVDTANGFAGTVADPTGDAIITLTTTVTGILQGNGTAISAATAGTDYVAPGDVTTSGLTMVTARLLGRTTSGTAAIESISVNSSLSLASTTLGLNLAHTNVFTAQQEMTAIKLNGSNSGYVSFTPPATAGTQNYTLPAATPGGAGEFLTSTAGGALSWATPQGSGTTTNAVTFNNGGSGAASGTTFDGSVARTISYNTLGAQALNANLTGLSGLTYTSGSPLVRMTGTGMFTLDGAAYVTGTATQYAVLVGGASNTVASVTGGAAGQVLRYVSGANPAWSTATYPNTTSINRILYSSANNVVDEITAPSDATFLRYTTAGGYSWQSAVTSLGFGTQGLITNGGTAAAPVLAVSGNSGGVVYFSNATTWASSGTLDQYELVVGGGAGSPPITINNSATAGAILTSNGNSNNPSWTAATYPTSTSINRILFSSANNVIDEIVAPNTADTFLKWDGTTFTWDTAGGGGGGGTTTNSLTINNSGAGDSSGITFNGSASVTISSNTILPSFAGNAGYALVVNGTSDNVQWSPVGNVTGAGNAGRVAYWDSGSNITGSADFYWDNSTKFLGIGTTTPECGLHVTTTGSQNIKGIMNMHFDNTASAQAKYIGARARGNNPNNPSALQTDDAITSLSGRGYKATTWSNTVGGYYVYAAENWTDAATGTYLTFRGVVSGGTTVSEWARLTSSSTLVELALGQSSTKSGGLLLYSSGGAFTTRLQASPSASSSETYILPATDGTSGQLLSTDGNGVMSWITGIGSGDVVGPSSATDGDFVVFDGTTGKLIKEPLNASLTAAGRATFNNGVNIGVAASATTGTLVFTNGTNSFTTTIQQGGSSTASASYTWPLAPGTNGQILSTDGSGNLSWTAAGSGDMTTTTNQTVTGIKTFGIASNVGKLAIAGNTSGSIILAAPATAAGTVTFPNGTQTLAGLATAQTFTAAQTFQAGIALNTGGAFTTAAAVASTFSGAASFAASAASAATVTINNGANASLTNPQLLIGGGTSGVTIQYIGFGPTNMQGNRDIPNTASRSIGTKIVLFNNVGAGNADHAIGVAPGVTWISAPTATGHKTSIYGGASELASFKNNGIYAEMPGTSTQGQITIGANTAGNFAYIDFGALTNVRATPTTTAASNVGKRITLFGDSHSIGVGPNETWITTNNVTGGIVSFYGQGATNFEKIAQIFASSSTNCVFDLTGAGTSSQYRINGTKVVGPRRTGWTAQTATASRADLGANPTTGQLASFCRALYDDLASAVGHGLIN